MKRNILLALALAAALAGMVFWALAQPAPRATASLFPAGASVYLEAKDLAALLTAWNGSAEKSDWLASANYESFSRSTLFLKLSAAQMEFASAAGVPPDYALLASAAGSNSAVAMYDIGKLEFLYVTHIASARAMNTPLWKKRGSYQTRHAGNSDYFVAEDKASHRVAAFAYTGDLLLLASRENLLAGALQLLAGDALPSVASERWFTDSVQAAGAGQGDLRLVYNMATLARSYQFRSYWVQGNVRDLRQFSAGLTDLDRASNEIRERRVLLRASPVNSTEGAESGTGQLLAALPADAGLYRAWLRPPALQAARSIEEKLFPLASASAPRSKAAPSVVDTADQGSELDLESRIDERPLSENRDAMKAFGDRLNASSLEAMLEVSSTTLDTDRIYVHPHTAIALLASSAWDADAMRAALGAAAEGTWANSGTAAWRSLNTGVRQLEGLAKLAVAIDGKWLVVGDSPEIVEAVFARRNRPAVPGASYAAGWRHARELPNFEQLTKMIDFPQLPAVSADQPPGAGEPPFFSGNLASLGRVWKRLDSTAIAAHDTGVLVRESVIYKLNP